MESPSATSFEPAASLPDETERAFAALAHAVRREILVMLRSNGGEMSAGDIAERFGCSWPTITRHLKVLLEAGLVEVAPRGRERVYHLKRKRLRRILGAWLAPFA